MSTRDTENENRQADRDSMLHGVRPQPQPAPGPRHVHGRSLDVNPVSSSRGQARRASCCPHVLSLDFWLFWFPNKASLRCALSQRTLSPLEQGPPTSGLQTSTSHYYSVMIIIIKCTISAMLLNHPETIPFALVCGYMIFHETLVLGA